MDPIAPEGKIWICLACGKTAKNKYGPPDCMKGWDASCVMNSALVDEKYVVYGEDGRVKEIKEAEND